MSLESFMVRIVVSFSYFSAISSISSVRVYTFSLSGFNECLWKVLW